MIKKYISISLMVELLLTIIGIILIYEGYFEIDILFRAIIILMLMMVYKWIGHKIGIVRETYKIDFDEILHSKERENSKKVKERMIKIFSSKIFKKHKILYDIIFFAYFILFPWNWISYIVIYIYSKIFGIKVWINGNKDVLFKKYFNIDVKSINLSLNNNKIYKVYNWVIKYPILRLLLMPNKIRMNIWKRKSYMELLRVRYLAYIISVILLYYGYYDFINGLNLWEKLSLVYVYIAIIWPIIMYLYIEYGDKHLEYSLYLYPNVNIYITNNSNSITWNLFGVYIKTVNEVSNGYLFIKYDFSSDDGMKKDHYRKINVDEKSGLFILNLSYEEIWRYEKNYGVSFFVYRVLNLRMSYYQADKVKKLYEIGVEKLGREVVEKEYLKYVFRSIEVYKYWLILMMDIRRLIGYKREDWILLPKNCLANRYSMDELSSEIKKEFDIAIKISNKFVLSNKLYNNLLRNVGYFFLNDFDIIQIDNTWEEWEREEILGIKESLMNKLAKENKNENGWSYWWENLEGREEWEKYDNEYLESICREVEEYYIKEYEKLEDKNVLISNKQLKKIKKIIKEDK